MHTKYPFAALLFCACSVTAQASTPSNSPNDPVGRALADSSRPHTSAVEADENRKPEETIRFAGIRPGQVVVDYLANAGYYTRLLSDVVGSAGHVYAVELEPA